MRELFKNPRAISAIVPPALAEVPGGRLPYGGVFVVCATLERLCDCVLACRVLRAWARSYDRGYIVAVSWPCRGRPGVAVCLSGRGRGRGGRVAFLCHRRVVATCQRMLVFAMVLVVSHVSICATNWLPV